MQRAAGLPARRGGAPTGAPSSPPTARCWGCGSAWVPAWRCAGAAAAAGQAEQAALPLARRRQASPLPSAVAHEAAESQAAAAQRASVATAAAPPPAAAAAAAGAVPAWAAAWADGDVVRLLLAGGGHVYAEVVSLAQQPPQPPQGRPAAKPHKQQRRGAPLGQRPAAAARTSSSNSGNGSGSDGGGELQLLVHGTRYGLRREQQQEAAADGRWVLRATGGALAAADPLFSAALPQHLPLLRAWSPLAARLLRPPAPQAPQQEQAEQEQAQQMQPGATEWALDGREACGAERVTSAQELRDAASSNPAPWCDGVGPGDPPPSPAAVALDPAGELACLLAGRRGVVLLQLHVGWDDAAPPYGPYRPLVLRLLREALTQRPDITSYVSVAPTPAAAGGGGASAAAGSGAAAVAAAASYGLTAVLCADKEPFRSWAAHLAGFSCQAALEAQSPYYKLLIGRVLGYRNDSVAHHIKVKHGREPGQEVAAAVQAQLEGLSRKQLVLPWTASSRGPGGGGGRKKAA